MKKRLIFCFVLLVLVSTVTAVSLADMDFDGNGRITIGDIIELIKDFGRTSSMDLTNDTIVNLFDIVMVARNIGEEVPLQDYCGDGTLDAGEQCEPSGSANNVNCSETRSGCVGVKLGTRDEYGDCNVNCECVYDEFVELVCDSLNCGAECDANNACDDFNSRTIDRCDLESCDCIHEMIDTIPPVNKKVMLLIFHPYLEAYGQKIIDYIGYWNDPDWLTQQYIDDVKDISGGYVNYEVVHRLEVDAYPVKMDGFVYTDEEWLQCWYNHSTCHEPDIIDYPLMLETYGVCELLNSGEIDELWMQGGPWFGFYESAMAGPNAYQINGPVYTNTACNSRLPIMGFNYERGGSEMLEDLGHRTESTMRHVFGSWNMDQSNHDWDRYTHNRFHTPGVSYYQCGNVHFAPNSVRDYDWSNTDYVRSNCDDWYNYPNMTGAARNFNCMEWNCQGYEYLKWWFRHLPRVDGEKDGIRNNWWYYIVNLNEY